ncbi:uncharacterized protein LOC106163774 [Lingula anatina]|uniref:Uncharacterized protein LOC106163774 n=1 Tax=Lingula anatina TaxID=7574 RepID=A0A1S3IFI9_LINAN|nr:uncharacterized protein LOC106163774 [Lingula anatina]|eukprot:XP_013396908.1 uncharacterized protein LOC106163774 [Lingula anatina]
MAFILVEFIDGADVAIISEKWLNEDRKSAFWPPFKKEKSLISAIKAHLQPDKLTWTKYTVRVLYEHDDYDKVRGKLRKSQYESDLQSDSEVGLGRYRRTKRPNPRYEDTDDDDEEEEEEEEDESQCLVPPHKIRKIHQNSTSFTSLPTPPRPAGKTLFDNNSIFETKVITSLEEVKCQVQLNSKLLQKVLKCLQENNHQQQHQDQSDGDNAQSLLPISSMEELQSFEEYLQEGDAFRKMVDLLKCVGGSDYKSTVRNVLSHIFSPCVALQINWLGKGGKMGFSQLKKIRHLVETTVRKNRLCPMTTEAEINETIKLWFRYAGDRNGGRIRRQKNSMAPSPSAVLQS